MFRLVVTVTTSPAANGAAGRKLPPAPSESPSTVPGCAPLTDPVTVIAPSWSAGRPRKVIWVAGEAKWLPGIGNTSTAGGLFAGGFVAAAPAPAATAPDAPARDSRAARDSAAIAGQRRLLTPPACQ